MIEAIHTDESTDTTAQETYIVCDQNELEARELNFYLRAANRTEASQITSQIDDSEQRHSQNTLPFANIKLTHARLRSCKRLYSWN